MIDPAERGWGFGHAALAVGAGFLGVVVASAFVGLDASVAEIFGILVPVQAAATLGAIALMARDAPLKRAELGLAAEPSDGAGLLVGFGLNYVLSLAMFPLVQWLYDGDAPVQDIVETAELALTSWDRMLVALGAVILAPVTEELVFRGILLASLRRRYRQNTAVVVSAAVFSLWHLVLDTGALLAVPPLFVLGLVMARQVVRTGRIARAVFTHMGFNLATTIALFLSL